jgi:hypothetical protein
MVVRGSVWDAASWTSRSGTPASRNGHFEGVAKTVWGDPLADPGPSGESLHCPVGGVTVHPASGGADEDRTVGSLADVQVEHPSGSRGERDRDVLAARAHDPKGEMTALDVHVVDVRIQGFGDPQPVQRQQADQGVITSRAETGLDEQGAKLVAIQPDGARLVSTLGRRTLAAGFRVSTPSMWQ